MPEETILFICLHGAAKSLLAASHCQRLASERGVKVRAKFAGTEPDPELTPAAVAGLLAEGIDVRGQRPQRVTGDDIRNASRVVSFGCDLGALAPGVPVERWDDVPAVSENYRAARDVIVSRLPALLEAARTLGVTSTRCLSRRRVASLHIVEEGCRDGPIDSPGVSGGAALRWREPAGQRQKFQPAA